MNFFHWCAKYLGRSTKRASSSKDSLSAPAFAAYRAGEKIYDYRTGEWHDFTKKRGVLHTEILLPDHAPRNFADRAILWNAVEYAEKAKNAQTAREVEIGLPREIDLDTLQTLLREYIDQEFVQWGMCADLCIHKKREKNIHAHILLTLRPLNLDGTWGLKSKKEYILDAQGQRIKNNKGNWKSRNVSLTGWDDHSNAERWRAAWAKIINRELERRGLPPIDHRSYKRQGKEKEPQLHMGPSAAALENRGIRTEVGDKNRAIRERNRAREKTAKERPSFEEWLREYELEKEQGREQERER